MKDQYLKYYLFSLAILGVFFATEFMTANAYIPCDDSYYEYETESETGVSDTKYLNGGYDWLYFSIYHSVYIRRWVEITGRFPNCNWEYHSWVANGTANTCQDYSNFVAVHTGGVYIDLGPTYTKSIAPGTGDIQLKIHYEVHAGSDHKSMDYYHVWDLSAYIFVDQTDWYNS